MIQVQLLPHLALNHLLVVDRGFSAVWLFTYLTQLDNRSLAHIDGVHWPEVQASLRSGRFRAPPRAPRLPPGPPTLAGIDR